MSVLAVIPARISWLAPLRHRWVVLVDDVPIASAETLDAASAYIALAPVRGRSTRILSSDVEIVDASAEGR